MRALGKEKIREGERGILEGKFSSSGLVLLFQPYLLLYSCSLTSATWVLFQVLELKMHP